MAEVLRVGYEGFAIIEVPWSVDLDTIIVEPGGIKIRLKSPMPVALTGFCTPALDGLRRCK